MGRVNVQGRGRIVFLKIIRRKTIAIRKLNEKSCGTISGLITLKSEINSNKRIYFTTKKWILEFHISWLLLQCCKFEVECLKLNEYG